MLRQQATAVVVDPEEAGSYYVAGWTWGDYFEENAGDDNDDGEDELGLKRNVDRSGDSSLLNP